MTIQEAIKNGKKFKRMSDKLWITVNSAGTIHVLGCGYGAHITSYDLLATDWEVSLCERHDSATNQAQPMSCWDCDDEKGQPWDHGITEEQKDKFRKDWNASWSKKCTCPKLEVMQSGCKCGGS